MIGLPTAEQEILGFFGSELKMSPLEKAKCPENDIEVRFRHLGLSNAELSQSQVLGNLCNDDSMDK